MRERRKTAKLRANERIAKTMSAVQQIRYNRILFLETVIKNMRFMQDPLQMWIQFIMNSIPSRGPFEMKHNHVSDSHCNSGFSNQPMHLNVVCSLGPGDILRPFHCYVVLVTEEGWIIRL